MPWDERTKRALKLRNFEILQAVAQDRTMGKAAARLRTSQPAISKAIADLERLLGVRLLDRGRHGAEPTQYGLALIKRGMAAFDELRRGIEDVEFLADPTAGELRIGSTDFVMGSIVSTVVDRLSRQHPRISFHITAAEAATLRHELHERKIELLVGRMYGVHPEADTHTEILYQDPLVVVVDRKHPLARRRAVELAELTNEPWTLPPPGTPSGSFVFDAFQRSGLGPPRIAVSTYSFPMRHYVVATGRFITVLPKSTLRAIGRRLSLKALPVTLPGPEALVVIVTLKNRTLNPLAELFIKTARAAAKQ
jgi:DNA-binding transcriptional LysR family regulator